MTKTKKAKTLCQTCQAVRDWTADKHRTDPAKAAGLVLPRVTTAKWRVTYRDGVRFQQTADLCAKHFSDVLDRLTPKNYAVDLTLTKLR